MEKEIFPKIDLFPRLTRVGNTIRRFVYFFPEEAPDCMSEHYTPEESPEEPPEES